MTQYKQLTLQERYTIFALRKQGLSNAFIARDLARSPSTISRELRRNCSPSHGVYEADRADARARTRRSRSRRNQKLGSEDFSIVCDLLREKWSPEQISGVLKAHGILSISHETIYRYIWLDILMGGTLWKHLRQSGKLRRKRYNTYDSRGRLAHKRSIDDRPKSVANLNALGHWEIDTVHGKGSKDCIVTLVERKSGYLIIGKLRNRTNEQLNKAVIRLIKREPTEFKTITADNGTEFHGYRKIEEELPVKFYFAHPYHSWERGRNENCNGLIRQYLPKGSSMENLTQAECDKIANNLNERPRKRHNFKAPIEVLYG